MAKTKKKKPTVRMNLEMSQKVRDRLEQLSEDTDLSLSEVVRRSLSVFALLLSETRDGGTIVIRHPDKNEKEIVIV